MNSNEKILAQLRKKLEVYHDHQEAAKHKLIQIQEQLKFANKLVIETEEAIAALEGRTTETRRILEEAIKAAKPTPSLPAPVTITTVAKDEGLWHNGVMAEPGFHWKDGNLVPDSVPTTGSYDEKAFVELPPVDEGFEEIDPMQFNPKI